MNRTILIYLNKPSPDFVGVSNKQDTVGLKKQSKDAWAWRLLLSHWEYQSEHNGVPKIHGRMATVGLDDGVQPSFEWCAEKL